jgi:C-1 hydroxylase
MSEKENERIVKEYYDAHNRKDWDAVVKCFAEDMIVITADGRKRNLEEYKARLSKDYMKAFPDRKLSIKRMISKGDTVVVEFLVSATHSGEWMGIKPTNKRVEWSGVEIFDLEENKIKVRQSYGMRLSYLEQQLRQ